MNPVITLTSDFGQKDPYLASLKGELHRLLEHPVIVDISHEIEPFHIAQAAFIVQNSYSHFPEGSVHILFIDDTVSPENKPIIAKLNKHYFVCADNGILSLISPKFKPDDIYEIDIQKAPTNSFSTRAIFTQAAAHLMRGGAPSVIGKKTEQINVRIPFTPSVNNDKKPSLVRSFISIIMKTLSPTFLRNCLWKSGKDVRLPSKSATTRSNKWFVPMQK